MMLHLTIIINLLKIVCYQIHKSYLYVNDEPFYQKPFIYIYFYCFFYFLRL